jgi:hypothetical protein
MRLPLSSSEASGTTVTDQAGGLAHPFPKNNRGALPLSLPFLER